MRVMPVLGAHMSTAGGVSTSLDRAERIGCAAVQIFTKSNRRWFEKPLDPREIARFRGLAPGIGLRHLVSHAGYLINLASADMEVRRRSMQSMYDELVRAERLGIPWVVLHPGSHGGTGEDMGIRRVAVSLQILLRRTLGFKTGVLLETMAGQGTCIGWKFEHLEHIRRALRPASRVGICVDTCHIFAAGYDIRARAGYEAVIAELDRVIGIRHVKLFHLNDSVKPFGCRVDRHEHIGKGEIGAAAFGFLLNDQRFSGLPMVLETPKGPEMKEDVMNLRKLRSLIRRRLARRAAKSLAEVSG